MLTKIRLILGIIVIVLAGYGLITKNFVAQPYMMVALGAFVLVGGIKEHKNGQKRRAMISFILSVFVFTVFVQNLIN
jgi:heme O synthase-like polyprenyltransferase